MTNYAETPAPVEEPVLNADQVARAAALKIAKDVMTRSTGAFGGRALEERSSAGELVWLAEWILDGPAEMEDPDPDLGQTSESGVTLNTFVENGPTCPAMVHECLCANNRGAR